MRKDVMAGAAVGAALLGGAAFYYFRERAQEEPDFRALESDGDHQIRDYPALTVAETVVTGPRRDALDRASDSRRLPGRQVAGGRRIADAEPGNPGFWRSDGQRPALVRRRPGRSVADPRRHARGAKRR